MTTTTITTDPIKKIEQAYAKLQRAREIYEAGSVSRILGMVDHYVVTASQEAGGYLVTRDKACTCRDFSNRGDAERGQYCKHLLAVRLFTDAEPGAADPAPAPDPDDDLERKIDVLF